MEIDRACRTFDADCWPAPLSTYDAASREAEEAIIAPMHLICDEFAAFGYRRIAPSCATPKIRLHLKVTEF